MAVVEGFTPPAHDWLPGRRGVTLQYPAPSPVYACASGTVTVAGPIAGRGVISIRHEVGGRVVWSTYLPVTPSVAVGDHVQKGDMIGVVEGDSPTLHWGAKTGRRTYIDPIRMIASCELPNAVCYHRRDNASPPAGLRRGGAPADRSRSDERYPRGCSAE